MTTFTEYAGGSLDGLKQNEFVQLYKGWLEEYVFNDAFWEQYGEQFADFFAGDDWDSYFDIAINQNGDLDDQDGIAYPYLVLKDLALLVDDADLEAFNELLSALNVELGEMFGDGDTLDVKTGRTTQERTYFDSFELKEEADPVYYEIGFEDGPILGENGGDGDDGEKGDPASREGTGQNATFFAATPGTGGDDGGDGADALVIDDPGAYDAIRITSTGDGPNQILGGSGGDGGDGGEGGDGIAQGQQEADGANGGDGGDGGQSGYAIVNGNDDAQINTIVIEGDQDLTILGGTGGVAGAAGDGGDGKGSGENGDDGEPGIDGATSAAFSHRVDVDATGLDAHLTISGSDFDDTFVLGDKGNDLHATRGADSYELGDGEDIIRYTSLAKGDEGFGTDTLIGFEAGADKIDISYFVQGNDAWNFELNGSLLEIDFDGGGTDLTIEMQNMAGTLDRSDFITEIA